MKQQLLGIAWLATITLALPLAGRAAETRERPRSILEGVPALEKTVTYTDTKIPLGELMGTVAADAFQRLLTASADRLRQKQTASMIDSHLRNAETPEQMRRDEAVHALQSPVQRTLALLVNQLPAEQWDRLLATGRLTFSTQPGP